MKIVATDIPKTIEDYQIALNAAFEGGKAYGAAIEREECAKLAEKFDEAETFEDCCPDVIAFAIRERI